MQAKWKSPKNVIDDALPSLYSVHISPHFWIFYVRTNKRKNFFSHHITGIFIRENLISALQASLPPTNHILTFWQSIVIRGNTCKLFTRFILFRFIFNVFNLNLTWSKIIQFHFCLQSKMWRNIQINCSFRGLRLQIGLNMSEIVR